jgi:hypothetical protein
VGREGGFGGLAVLYQRDAAGALLGVARRMDGVETPGPLPRPDGKVTSLHLDQLPPFVERHEVLLLLGPAFTHSVDGKGLRRRITDSYAGEDCWLDKTSTVEYDATGLIAKAYVTCICGFCVAAPEPLLGEEVLGADEHWTAGPWVRLDGRLEVTSEHRLMTPGGPVAAGALRAGDEVLRADGGVHTLRSVELLPPGPPRLGRNLRTASGAFVAGGLLFESEQGCR